MSQVIAVGSPKGGVGKTVSAIHLACIAAKILKLHVLLADGDPNHSALDYAATADDEAMPIDVASAVGEPDHLRQLRSGGHDLTMLDLAGAREGNFEFMLKGGPDGMPIPHLLLVPIRAGIIDMRPIVRVLEREIIPLGIPYLAFFTRCHPLSIERARARRDELVEDHGINVAETIIREYVIYEDAAENGKTVLDLPGRHSYARAAEDDYRNLAREAFEPLGFDTAPLEEPSKWLAG